MKLLYITYIDFGEFKSGSSVRPQMMYDAFLELGHEVKLLQTQQNRRKERREAVKEINRWLDSNRPDFCYVESPSGPIFNRCDLRLLKRLKRMGIRTGYFYRDAAFRFDEIFIPGKKTLKQHVIAWMSERDVRFLEKNVELVYLPTLSMANYFRFPNVKPLPPACTGSSAVKTERKNGKKCIYVGGVSKRYGTDTLLRAFELLNGSGAEYPLILVCREAQAGYIKESYRGKPWLEIVHASGKESLSKLYGEADLALYPVEKNAYNDFAFSVKLLEYLEFGLPVVSVDCEEAARFTRQFQTGLVSRDDPSDFAEKIREILEDPNLYRQIAENVVTAARQNRWIDRARQVTGDLAGREESTI